MRREVLQLRRRVLRLSLLLPLPLWSLLLCLQRRPSTPRGRPMGPVSPPPRGRRGDLRRKGVQRAVTSEVAGLTAFETGNHRGKCLIDRPTGREKLRGRLPARIPPTSTCLVPLLISQLHRAPFDGHLPHQIKNFLGLSFEAPLISILCSTLSLNSGGCNSATSALLMTAAEPRLYAPSVSRKTRSALGFSKYCSRRLWTVSIRSTAVASNPMVTRRHTSAAAIDRWIESSVQNSAFFASASRKSSSCNSIPSK